MDCIKKKNVWRTRLQKRSNKVQERFALIYMYLQQHDQLEHSDPPLSQLFLVSSAIHTHQHSTECYFPQPEFLHFHIFSAKWGK